MDPVEEVLTLFDELNTDQWKELSYDRLQKELAELKGMQRLCDNAIGWCERKIRTHEMDPSYLEYLQRKEDKVMLKERSARLQRLATQVQTLLKLP